MLNQFWSWNDENRMGSLKFLNRGGRMHNSLGVLLHTQPPQKIVVTILMLEISKRYDYVETSNKAINNGPGK